MAVSHNIENMHNLLLLFVGTILPMNASIRISRICFYI